MTVAKMNEKMREDLAYCESSSGGAAGDAVSFAAPYGGARLDALIADMMEDMSRSRAQKLIAAGSVEVGGEKELSKKAKVPEGASVTVFVPEPEPLDVVPEEIPIDVVYEDDDLIVINKPFGMVVHPAPGNTSGTLVNALLYHCKDSLSSINGVARPGIVHRIDKDTTGLLVVAKTDRAHVGLSEQLFDHSMTRKYVALVRDNLKDDEGVIDKDLGRDRRDRKKRAVGGSNPKRAVTHYKVLERFGVATLAELVLETGRTHQIRVHMAYIRHPVLGDPVYGNGSEVLSAGQGKVKVPEGQLLHAKTLGFKHPVTGEYMEFDSELPERIKAVLGELENK